MQTYVDELVQQSTDAGMIANDRKTNEMLIGTAILKDGDAQRCIDWYSRNF